jgi:4-hydroxy-tetrahydrodipicolinate reductase
MHKIAVIGYGRMGRRIAELAPEFGFKVGAVIDREEDWDEQAEPLKQCEVAIEFTTPDAAPGNIKKLLEAGLDVVSGTTGWNDSLEELSATAEKLGKGLMVASNFSIGMNLFFVLNRYVADLFKQLPGYRVSVEEVHHVHKLDKPSGTAKKLVSDLQEMLSDSTHGGGGCGCGCNQTPEIPVNALREGEVTGIHRVQWAGNEDVISIHHEALNRDGFTRGALLAARWIKGKTGRVTMSQMLFNEIA